MSKVINISFDAKQLNKELMNEGWVSLDLIPLKEAKVKTKKDGTPIVGDGWKLMKTHFIKQSNKEKGAEMPIIGEGTSFDREATEPIKFEDDIKTEDIPF